MTVTAFGLVAIAFRYGGLEVGPSGNTLLAGGIVFAFSYSVGVMLARLRAPHSVPFGVSATLVGGTLLALLVFPGPLHTPITAARDAFCVIIAFPALVALGGAATVGPCGRRICDILGRLSYPIYIINFPILIATSTLAMRHSAPGWIGYAAMPLVLLSVVSISWLALKYYDQPARSGLMAWKRRLPFS